MRVRVGGRVGVDEVAMVTAGEREPRSVRMEGGGRCRCSRRRWWQMNGDDNDCVLGWPAYFGDAVHRPPSTVGDSGGDALSPSESESGYQSAAHVTTAVSRRAMEQRRCGRLSAVSAVSAVAPWDEARRGARTSDISELVRDGSTDAPAPSSTSAGDWSNIKIPLTLHMISSGPERCGSTLLNQLFFLFARGEVGGKSDGLFV